MPDAGQSEEVITAAHTCSVEEAVAIVRTERVEAWPEKSVPELVSLQASVCWFRLNPWLYSSFGHIQFMFPWPELVAQSGQPTLCRLKGSKQDGRRTERLLVVHSPLGLPQYDASDPTGPLWRCPESGAWYIAADLSDGDVVNVAVDQNVPLSLASAVDLVPMREDRGYERCESGLRLLCSLGDHDDRAKCPNLTSGLCQLVSNYVFVRFAHGGLKWQYPAARPPAALRGQAEATLRLIAQQGTGPLGGLYVVDNGGQALFDAMTWMLGNAFPLVGEAFAEWCAP
jgi:hypothetical protein